MSHQPLMRFSSFFFTCLFTGVPSAFLTCCCFFGVLVFRDLEDPLDEELLGDDAELPESVEAQDEQCEWRVIFRHPSTYNHTKQQQQQQIAPHHSKHFDPLDASTQKINYHTLFSLKPTKILTLCTTRPSLHFKHFRSNPLQHSILHPETSAL